MSTDRSTHTTLTTQQLIAACAREGVTVSSSQLGRWSREGLLPAARRHRKPRGYGAEWHWEAECLPRALIIARTLASGDPSLGRAAQMLARAGYAPSAARLRQVLLNGVDAFERMATHREPYLREPTLLPDMKRKRLRRHLKRKGADLPDAVLASVTTYAQALHGLSGVDPSASAPAIGAAGQGWEQYVSLEAMRQALIEVRDADLLDAYAQAGQGLLQSLPLFTTLFNVLLLPFLADRLTLDGKSTEGLPQGVSLEVILADLKQDNGRTIVSPENPAGLLRLYFTVALAQVRTQGDHMIEALAKPMFALGDTLIDLAKGRGFPGAETLSFNVGGGQDQDSVEAAK